MRGGRQSSSGSGSQVLRAPCQRFRNRYVWSQRRVWCYHRVECTTTQDTTPSGGSRCAAVACDVTMCRDVTTMCCDVTTTGCDVTLCRCGVTRRTRT